MVVSMSCASVSRHLITTLYDRRRGGDGACGGGLARGAAHPQGQFPCLGQQYPREVSTTTCYLGYRKLIDDSRMNNPFHGWDEDDVERVGKKLALVYGVADAKDIFIRVSSVLLIEGQPRIDQEQAAKVLFKPDPHDWDFIGLSAHETHVLNHEKNTSFWDQPWPLQTTFFVLFVAAIVQGWNQTGTTGANLGWPKDLLYDGTDNTTFLNERLNDNCAPGEPETWIFGAVNAMPYLAASM